MAKSQTRCVGEYIGHKADGGQVRVQKLQEFRAYKTRSGLKTLGGDVRLATEAGQAVTRDDEGQYWLLAEAISVPLAFDSFAAPYQNKFPAAVTSS